MKLNLSLIGIALSVSASYALADVTLTVPEHIDLLSVNMQKPKIEGSVFGDKTVVLKNGMNQMVFRYIPSFDEGDNVKKVYSDAIIVKFESRDEDLSFQVPRFRSIKEAKEKMATLKWQLIKKDGQEITVVEDKLPNPGVQWGRNYSQEATEYNQNGGVASIGFHKLVTDEEQLSVSEAVDKKAEIVPSKELIVSSNLNQLQLWYSKASKEERKAFKKWMIDQE